MTDPVGQKRLRVASYNLHSCVGTDGVFAPSRIADVLATINADFVALQEVEERRYEGKRVSAYLANALGLHIAGHTSHKRAGIDYGNALLSQTPPQRIRSHNLAVARREPRAAIDAEFSIDGLSLRLINTHFGLSMRERRRQLHKILPHLDDRGADLTVLCADFNEWLPYARIHRVLGRVLGAAPAVRSFPSRRAVLALDRFYAAPLDALVNVEAIATSTARKASDHLPVVAEFDLEVLTRPR